MSLAGVVQIVGAHVQLPPTLDSADTNSDTARIVGRRSLVPDTVAVAAVELLAAPVN